MIFAKMNSKQKYDLNFISSRADGLMEFRNDLDRKLYEGGFDFRRSSVSTQS